MPKFFNFHHISPSQFGFLVLSVLLIACGPSEDQTTAEVVEENPIKGKWKLHKRMFAPDTTFKVNPDTIEYMKIITDGTFIWYQYDKENKSVIALGGGSYELEGGSYIEHIEFYHPPGDNLEGADIPFKCEIIGDEWHHSGYINEREYDEEIGDFVILQERRLEEIWKRVE